MGESQKVHLLLSFIVFKLHFSPKIRGPSFHVDLKQEFPTFEKGSIGIFYEFADGSETARATVFGLFFEFLAQLRPPGIIIPQPHNF